VVAPCLAFVESEDETREAEVGSLPSIGLRWEGAIRARNASRSTLDTLFSLYLLV
jgi:hypothetical protein